jgi:hypothetical protein
MSAHWRNVWLLAAGRIFADIRPLRRTVASVPDAVDDESVTSMWVTPGARLALEILEEETTRHEPESEAMLLRSGLRMLDSPMSVEINGLAAFLERRLETGSADRLWDALTTALVSKLSDRSAPQLGVMQMVLAVSDRPGRFAEDVRLRWRRYRTALERERPDLLREIDELPAPEHGRMERSSLRIGAGAAAIIADALREEGIDPELMSQAWIGSVAWNPSEPEPADVQTRAVRDTVCAAASGLPSRYVQSAREIHERMSGLLAHDFTGHLLNQAMGDEQIAGLIRWAR